MLQTLHQVLYYKNPSFIHLVFSGDFGRFLNSSLFQCIIGTKATKEFTSVRFIPRWWYWSAVKVRSTSEMLTFYMSVFYFLRANWEKWWWQWNKRWTKGQSVTFTSTWQLEQEIPVVINASKSTAKLFKKKEIINKDLFSLLRKQNLLRMQRKVTSLKLPLTILHYPGNTVHLITALVTSFTSRGEESSAW